MSWDFDYEKAWKTLARPMMEEQPHEILELLQLTARTAAGTAQNKALGMDWPEDPAFKAAFAAIEPEDLFRAQSIAYYYGHWYPGKHAEPDKAWQLPDLLVDSSGGYWKFQKYARQHLIDIGHHGIETPSWDIPEFRDGALKPECYKHKKDTDLTTEEMKYKYMTLVPKLVEVHDVIHCNYKVNGQPGHPFCIGARHFPKDGGMYIDPLQAPCAYGKGRDKCNMPLEDHVYDTVLVLKLTGDTDNDTLGKALKPLADKLDEDNIDGVTFLQTKFEITP
jgi:hypothetical protein